MQTQKSKTPKAVEKQCTSYTIYNVASNADYRS